ncbi:MAG TPA: hypothetical protein VE130_11615 [Nitrososphaeraceae archaeon]|nr:hypothetical protein [Nitrososphaeraceae archaeon]
MVARKVGKSEIIGVPIAEPSACGNTFGNSNKGSLVGQAIKLGQA